MKTEEQPVVIMEIGDELRHKLELIRQLKQELRRLHGVLHAIELCNSGSKAASLARAALKESIL